MGRDIRQAKTGLDRNKYYKAEYVQNMQLTNEAIPKGVFYSTDAEPSNQVSILTGSVRHQQTSIKIITDDYVPDLVSDDYVLHNGELWIVENVLRADINDNAKPFRNNPLRTTISMRR